MDGRPVVIDTNCLVQMISKHSPYRKIWDAFSYSNQAPAPLFIIHYTLTRPRLPNNFRLPNITAVKLHFFTKSFGN